MRLVQPVLRSDTLLASLTGFTAKLIHLLLICYPGSPHYLGTSTEAIRKTKVHGGQRDFIVVVHNHSNAQVRQFHLSLQIKHESN